MKLGTWQNFWWIFMVILDPILFRKTNCWQCVDVHGSESFSKHPLTYCFTNPTVLFKLIILLFSRYKLVPQLPAAENEVLYSIIQNKTEIFCWLKSFSCYCFLFKFYFHHISHSFWTHLTSHLPGTYSNDRKRRQSHTSQLCPRLDEVSHSSYPQG